VDETAEQVRQALSALTSSDCSGVVQHTHRLIDEWLKTDAVDSLMQFSSAAPRRFGEGRGGRPGACASKLRDVLPVSSRSVAGVHRADLPSKLGTEPRRPLCVRS